MLTLLAVLNGCGRNDPPPAASTPAGPRTSVGSDWTAFQGGDALQGQADVLPVPLHVRWSVSTAWENPPGVEAGAVIAGESVYVADSGGVLHALDLATGQERWTFRSSEAFAATPLVSDAGGTPLILLGDLGGVFYAIESATGKERWRYDTGAGIHAPANRTPDGGVIVGNDSAQILCFDAATGQIRWNAKADSRLNSAPAIAQGLAFFSGCDAKLRALETTTGRQRFCVDIQAVGPGSPAAARDTLVLGTDQGKVLAFDGAGRPQWTYHGVANEAMVYASPAVAGKTAVVGARDHQVHALDILTGQPRWVFPTQGDVDASPLISGGLVFVASRDKRLYALDLHSGALRWRFLASGGIVAPLAIGRGVLVMADEGGRVYCLE